MPEQHPLDLPEDHPFGPHTLPYGVFGTADEPERRRIGVRYGDHVLD
ncbi:fumarylacetoacetase, partial [Streptomyces rimosus]